MPRVKYALTTVFLYISKILWNGCIIYIYKIIYINNNNPCETAKKQFIQIVNCELCSLTEHLDCHWQAWWKTQSSPVFVLYHAYTQCWLALHDLRHLEVSDQTAAEKPTRTLNLIPKALYKTILQTIIAQPKKNKYKIWH